VRALSCRCRHRRHLDGRRLEVGPGGAHGTLRSAAEKGRRNEESRPLGFGLFYTSSFQIDKSQPSIEMDGSYLSAIRVFSGLGRTNC
jgi:hypothetical protein